MKSQFNRSAIYVALGLSIALVVGVLFGAKWVYDHTELEPVAVAPVPSDKADSAECQAFIDALPETFQGHRRADGLVELRGVPLDWLVRTAVGYADEVEIIEPPEARERIIDLLRQALKEGER